MPAYKRRTAPYRKSGTKKRKYAASSKSKASAAKRKSTYSRQKSAHIKRTLAKRSFKKSVTWSRIRPALQKPQSFKFKLCWLESKNISAPSSQVYNLKVVPGALFGPRMNFNSPNAWTMAISQKAQISGGSSGLTNYQPAGYDQLDNIFSRCSVYKSFMKVTIYSESTQPLQVAYATRTGARIGAMGTSANSAGTLDYVSNISWASQIGELAGVPQYNATKGTADFLVDESQPAYVYRTPLTGSPYYEEKPAHVCNPINLLNNNKVKSFVWQQCEQQSGGRTKVITFPVDHKKFVKNWKLRATNMSHGSNATDSTVGDSVADALSNNDLLKNYPLMSPVNYLHIAPFLPSTGDLENVSSDAPTADTTEAGTVAALTKNSLSGLLRIKIELIMEAYLSGVSQELVDDGDVHNSNSVYT